MMWKALLLVATPLALLTLTEGAVLCYYESWAVYRPGGGKVVIDDLDPSVCTHYIYAFAGLGADYTVKVLDPWADLCDNWGMCGYKKFTNMKLNEPGLLTLLGVGGWNEGSARYSLMASSPTNRATFITSVMALLRAHNFDGMSLDWQYPTQRGGAPEDRANYVILLRELKEALHSNGMILTIAVASSRAIIDQAYDIPNIVENVDLVNVMSYDFHGPWEPYTHHHAGLFAFSGDVGGNEYLNVEASIIYWLSGGMPANKLMMGVATFGRCWKLDPGEQHGYYTLASQAGHAGPWTGTPGFMAYSEICTAQAAEGWTVAIEEGCREPYTYHIPSNRIWCSYDDKGSVIIKGHHAAAEGLAGVMVWSINDDDAHGTCTGRKFDLTRALGEAFNNSTMH